MDRDLRRLLVVVAALLVVLFVGRTLVSALYDSEAARREAFRYRNQLQGGGPAAARPARADMTAARALAAELEQTLDELAPRLAYVRPPDFDVPAGASPDLRYIEVLRREQEALVQAARYIGKSVPLDLGMPVPNPTGLEDVLAALRALHVVHVVVSAALQADVAAVDVIRVPPSPRRAAESGFLRTRPVEFELHGPPRALRDMLARVAAGSPYLALDEVSLQARDEDGESVSCRLTAAVVELDLEASVGREVRR